MDTASLKDGVAYVKESLGTVLVNLQHCEMGALVNPFCKRGNLREAE